MQGTAAWKRGRDFRTKSWKKQHKSKYIADLFWISCVFKLTYKSELNFYEWEDKKSSIFMSKGDSK